MTNYKNTTIYKPAKSESFIPILLTMLVIRLFQIIDTRYANLTSKDALTLYSIQVSFLIFAQFFGNAAMNLILVMWHQTKIKPETLYIYVRKKLGKFSIGFILASVFMLPVMFLQFNLGSSSISQEWTYTYFILCILSTFFISQQILLDSILIAQSQQKTVLYIATLTLFLNLISDNLFLSLKIQGYIKDYHFLVLSSIVTILIFVTSNIASYKFAFKEKNQARKRDSVPANSSQNGGELQEKSDSVLDFSRMDALWKFELGVALSRSLPPFVFTYLCGFMLNPSEFLSIYFAANNIGFICTLPLISSLPIAIKNFTLSPEATEYSTKQHNLWLHDIIKFGLLPALGILGICTIFSKKIFDWIFEINLDRNHLSFVYLYFCGLAIASFGHILSVPIRAKGKTNLIVKSLIIAEISSNILGMIALILLGLATPIWIGILGILYAFVYVLSNSVSMLNLSPNRWHLKSNRPD